MIVKRKYDSPVGANRNRPIAFQGTLERVQPEARQRHIRDRFGGVKTRQNIAQLLNVPGRHPAPVVVIAEAPQALVAD
jgi:hypothetical protein